MTRAAGWLFGCALAALGCAGEDGGGIVPGDWELSANNPRMASSCWAECQDYCAALDACDALGLFDAEAQAACLARCDDRALTVPVDPAVLGCSRLKDECVVFYRCAQAGGWLHQDQFADEPADWTPVEPCSWTPPGDDDAG